MIRMGVSGQMFLLVPAHLGSPAQRPLNGCVCVYCTVGGTVPDASLLPDVSGLREELLATLEHAMLGDRLAAEYLLCHLASSV